MNTPSSDPRQLEALLDFYLASGVDVVLDEEPVDWFARSEKIVQARTQQADAGHLAAPAGAAPFAGALAGQPSADRSAEPANAGRRGAPLQAGPASGAPGQFQSSAQSSPQVTIPDEAAILAAREMAAKAGSLDDLRACLDTFEGCNLKRTAKSLVFSDGDPEARVMFIGEAPGREEDLQGKPFAGQSGRLLDRMLAAIGLDRSSAYIANMVPWRPPGNRTPTPQETEICRPFIVRQVELVDPEIVVFLGAAPVKTLLGAKDGIRKLRGRWMSYAPADREMAALVTFHPDHLLRNPLEKRLSWHDFLSLKARLAGV